MRQLLLRLVLAALVLPCVHAQSIPPSDLDLKAKTQREMVLFNPQYKALKAARQPILTALSDQVFAMEGKGQKAACSHQVLIEVIWLMGYTADFPRIDRRLADLKESLAHPELEGRAEEQDPVDGSYGRCYMEWMERLDASYDYIQMLKERGIQPKYPYKFLDRINSPEALTSYIDSVAVSDVAHTGRDNRKELNGAFVNTVRLIMGDDPPGYKWDPRLKKVLLDLVVNKYQNQATGWWGESYRRGGKVEFVDDLSITFHVVQALHGKVPNKDKMATTLFAVKDLSYPVGWLELGEQTNHNNMDVVVLMRDAWPDMSDAQRVRAAGEIRRMLKWCLAESLQPDGSFKAGAGGDDSIEEGTHFGVGFLARIGYFDRKKRFWTSDDFPEAEARRQNIVHFIETHKATGAAGGTYYSSSLQELVP